MNANILNECNMITKVNEFRIYNASLGKLCHENVFTANRCKKTSNN